MLTETDQTIIRISGQLLAFKQALDQANAELAELKKQLKEQEEPKDDGAEA